MVNAGANDVGGIDVVVSAADAFDADDAFMSADADTEAFFNRAASMYDIAVLGLCIASNTVAGVGIS